MLYKAFIGIIISMNSWLLFYLTNTFCGCNKYQTEINTVLIQNVNQRADLFP